MGSSFCLQDELGRQEINILLSCHHMPGTALGTNFNSVWFSPALILHRENSRAQGGGTDVLRVILISDQDLDPNLSNSRVLLLIPHPENTRYQERKTAISVEKEKSHQRQMPASLYGWWRGGGDPSSWDQGMSLPELVPKGSSQKSQRVPTESLQSCPVRKITDQ